MAYVGDTLFVRHLPRGLSEDERVDLLKHYGATNVKCMSDSGKMKYSAFATFCDAESAQKALQRLHQLEVLGCRLVVQYAHRSHEKEFPNISETTGLQEGVGNKQSNAASLKETSRYKMQEFGRNLNCIAQQFSLLYPISPKWKYRYPPPSPSILSNITEALVANPKFYTQVLHLMNKMNLPAPFGPAFNNPIIFPEAFEMNREVAKARNADVASGESELESEEEQTQEPIGEMKMKRPAKQTNLPKKRQKLQIVKKQSNEEAPTRGQVDPVDVFETTMPQVSKKIAIKITSSSSNPPEIPPAEIIPTTITNIQSSVEVFEPSDEKIEIESRDNNFITVKVLKENNIGEDEMKKLPVYKDYNPGDPTQRLYLKNLSKQVEQKDLNFIYGRYIDFDSDFEKSTFDVRVMQGPMRGQAFITLPSVEKAEKALKDTNGYVLMGKPIVVQFAKSPKVGQKK